MFFVPKRALGAYFHRRTASKMKNFSLAAGPALLGVLLFSMVGGGSVSAQGGETPYMPGEMLVMLEKGIDAEKWGWEWSRHTGAPADWHWAATPSPSAGVHLFRFASAGAGDAAWLQRIRGDRRVVAAQWNHYIEDRSTVPNDPNFGQQWHHVQSGDHDVDTDLAWDYSTGGFTANGDRIVVAILETGGSNYNHTDLIGNHWTNIHEIDNNGIDDDGNGYVDDVNGWNTTAGNDNIATGGHGTSVSGMIGATGNNGIGGVGINWSVGLMQVDISGNFTESSVIAGYEYPKVMRELYTSSGGELGAFVVATNASWGIDQANPNNYPVWCAYYDALGASGILNCGATTNSNLNVDAVGDMPTACSSDYMISVTATNNNDVRTFSGYGATTIDLAAPGDNVYLPSGSSAYSSTSGTSFASPCVAGAIALVYSAPCVDLAQLALQNPQGAASLVRSYILDGVDLVPNLTNETVTGGRLNVAQSMELAMGNCGPIVCELGAMEIETACVFNATTGAVETVGTFAAGLPSFLCTATSLCLRPEGAAEWVCTTSADWGSGWNVNNPLVVSGLIPGVTYEAYHASGEEISAVQTFQTPACDLLVPGCTDANALNFNALATISDGSCDYACTDVELSLLTDCWPEETGWTLVGSDGAVVASVAVGAYASDQGQESWAGCIPNGCYTFTITDEYGDGMNGSQWPFCDADGDYTMSSEGAVLFEMEEANFGSSTSHAFCVPAVPGCTDVEACNFDALATANDGSCAYVGQGTLSGPPAPVAGQAVQYVLNGANALNQFTWTIQGGVIEGVDSGIGVTSVTVVWGETSAGSGTLSVTESDATGCSGTTSQSFNFLTNGVFEGAAWRDIVLYPNPVRDQLHLEIPNGTEGLTFEVWDALGQLVSQGSVSGLGVNLDCSALSAGQYVLRLWTANREVSRDFQFTRER
jgi:hypothetical protein